MRNFIRCDGAPSTNGQGHGYIDNYAKFCWRDTYYKSSLPYVCEREELKPAEGECGTKARL